MLLSIFCKHVEPKRCNWGNVAIVQNGRKKVVSGVLFIRFQGSVKKIIFILLNLNMCYEVVVISIWGWYILRGHTYKCVLSS